MATIAVVSNTHTHASTYWLPSTFWSYEQFPKNSSTLHLCNTAPVPLSYCLPLVALLPPFKNSYDLNVRKIIYFRYGLLLQGGCMLGRIFSFARLSQLQQYIKGFSFSTPSTVEKWTFPYKCLLLSIHQVWNEIILHESRKFATNIPNVHMIIPCSTLLIFKERIF